MAPADEFTAVTTTGIYCLSVCSASPRPENTRSFDVAASAEAAGFRPCERCRPYRSSEPPRWLSGPELVSRAVQLVLDGALDHDGTEHELASALGISGRHLRRLFLDHVGTTPDQLARSGRAHFARRLLDVTDWPLTQIAYASGFGSPRQFNRVMNQTFRASPSRLRARRRRADRLEADGGLVLHLPYTPPLDWAAMVRVLDARALPGLESVDVAAGTYRRLIPVQSDAGVIEAGPAGEGALELRLHLPHWHDLIGIVRRVRRLFDLDAPIADIETTLAQDPRLAVLIAARPGLRIPRAWDSFEGAVRAVLAPHDCSLILQACGKRVAGLGALGLSHCFPTPTAVAGADLAATGLPASVTATVEHLAAAVVAKTLNLDHHQSLDSLVTTSREIAGIDEPTAARIAVALGERDALTTDDPRTVHEAEHWRPWRAYATRHLELATGAADGPVPNARGT